MWKETYLCFPEVSFSTIHSSWGSPCTSQGAACLLVCKNHCVSSEFYKAYMAPWREVQAAGMHGATVIIFSLSGLFQRKKKKSETKTETKTKTKPEKNPKTTFLQKIAGEKKDWGPSSGFLQLCLQWKIIKWVSLWLLDCSSARWRSMCLCKSGKMVPCCLQHLHELPDL